MHEWRPRIPRKSLVLHADRKPLLVVIKLELAAEILMAAEQQKDAP